MDEITKRSMRKHARTFSPDTTLYEFTSKMMWFLTGYDGDIPLREAAEYIDELYDERNAKHE